MDKEREDIIPGPDIVEDKLSDIKRSAVDAPHANMTTWITVQSNQVDDLP